MLVKSRICLLCFYIPEVICGCSWELVYTLSLVLLLQLRLPPLVRQDKLALGLVTRLGGCFGDRSVDAGNKLAAQRLRQLLSFFSQAFSYSRSSLLVTSLQWEVPWAWYCIARRLVTMKTQIPCQQRRDCCLERSAEQCPPAPPSDVSLSLLPATKPTNASDCRFATTSFP